MAVSLEYIRALAYGTSITEFPFHIHNNLTKKGEIKMERMHFFGDTKPKKREHSKEFKELAVNLASKIGVTKAAEELGVSTSSIYSWKKTFSIFNLAKSSAPIQDENGNLIFTLNTSEITTRDKDVCFTLEGKIYSLNVNSEEERERVKEEVNANSLAKYEWFKEETGKRHWVLYNTEMYEIKDFISLYLHYKEDSNLIPIIPINATSCYSMFKDCSRLTSLDIRNFNTNSVIDMRYMFKNCSKLTSLDLSNFDTSNVTTMSLMFDNCSSLISLNLSNFNTSNVTIMYCMFNSCYNLIQLDLSSFNTSNVTGMQAMFNYCKNITSLDINSFDTSNVIDMNHMFCHCELLTQFDLSSFNTSKVTNMSFMFGGCESLTQLDLSNFDTSQVIKMSCMFGGCESLTQLDLSNFDTSKVTDMGGMFTYCTELTNIFISNKWNTNRVDSSRDMLAKCHSLSNFNQEKTDAEMAKPVEQGGYLTLKR